MDMTTAHILDSLGWAVIHSLWQGALAALAVYLFRAMTRDSQAGLRCGFELVALGICFAAFIGTFTIKMLSPVSATPITTMVNELILPTATTPMTTGPAEIATSISGRSMTQYTPLLGILWCFGFLFLASRYTIGFAMTHRLRTRGLSAAPTQWQDRFHTLVLNSGIFRNVKLHISDRVKGPMTFGFFKPVVLVPASFFSRLPADQIEAILLHEIAHIRRHDYLINLAQTAIKTILFFHPAIHYICRTIDEDREKACDDFAVNYTRNPKALAKGLATLRLSLTPPEFAMAASHKQKPLLRRLTRLTAPEESRRRRPGQSWGQVATSLAALVVAAGIYSTANFEFANAHPPEPELAEFHDTKHVSADKKNYHFKTIWHDGREITVKLASDSSRWVYFNKSWFNIDKNPKILDAVPDFPEAPRMPNPDNFNSYVKFKKAANQYRVNLDYYIASLENNNCGKCTKDKLKWAKKQKARVSDPHPDFDKDLLWKEISVKDVTVPKPSPSPRPKPQPIVLPATPPKHVVKTAELAGAPVTNNRTLYLNGEKFEPDSWTEHSEDQFDHIAERFEDKMDRVETEFEAALEKFEHATAKFARDPVHKKAYFEQAQKDFASAVLAANSKRARLQSQLDQDINEMVEQHVEVMTSNIDETVERETWMAMETARIDAEKARQNHAKHYGSSYHTSDHHPTYSDYGQVMLAQLGNDGIIPHGSTSANVEYRKGKLYVNGTRVSENKAEGYCSINGAFEIDKSDNMLIEIRPTRLTITDYDNG